MEYASHDFHVRGSERAFFADMKFHDVRAEMRARKYRAVSAREVKHARLSLLWRNYRNIPFASLDAGEAKVPHVDRLGAAAQKMEHAHVITAFGRTSTRNAMVLAPRILSRLLVVCAQL